MFTWLSDLAYFLASFLPHLKIIRSTHAGVRFKYGHPHPIKSGRIIMYWPIVTELLILPKVRQTTELAPQVLITKDGAQLAITMAIVYRISDVFTAATEAWDIYTVIDDNAQAALAEVVADCQKAVVSEPKIMNDILRGVVQDKLKEYGVAVDKAFIISVSKCFTIRNIGDQLSWNPGRVIDEHGNKE